MAKRFIEIELTIDGRSTMPLLSGDVYRPHFRVEGGDYLGVSFVSGVQGKLNSKVRASAALMYEPGVDYSALVVGAQFEILEGQKAVGFGRVLQGPLTAG